MWLTVIVFVVFWFAGIFGWSQIIGSFQHFAYRGVLMSLFTILLWGGILFLLVFLVLRFFPQAKWGAYVGLGVSFLRILAAGHIE